MVANLKHAISGNKILILGFGLEGQSTGRFLKTYFPGKTVTVADRNDNLLETVDTGEFSGFKFILGEHYLESLDPYDLIIKAPGIPKSLIESRVNPGKLTSQTEIFLKLFRERTIGITGTKGKSTTSSLVSYILNESGVDAVLLGNIGNPPLDYADRITPKTHAIFEMSSHQLDGLNISPRISVFLNLFEEHLDHYKSLENYRKAKYNIFYHLNKSDWLIYNFDDQQLRSDLEVLEDHFNTMAFSLHAHSLTGIYRVDKNEITYHAGNDIVEFNFSKRNGIPGSHNLMNIMAAVCVCKLLNVNDHIVEKSVNLFKGLEHRLEFVGKYKDILFYNDSIATIPEATIEAIKTLGQVDTLILGGKDRGIDYSGLVLFLKGASLSNLILIGEVGIKLRSIFKKELPKSCRLFPIDKFDDIEEIIMHHTAKNSICLLSPAASSYGMFRNFSDRGHAFKRIVKSI